MTEETLRGGEEIPSIRSRALCWGRNAAFILGASIGSGLTLSHIFPAEVQLGPHDAAVVPTLDSMVTLDADPIGTLRAPTPSEAPRLVGVDIELGRIPSSEESARQTEEATPSLDQLREPAGLELNEIQRFANSYASMGTDIENIPRTLKNHLLLLTGLSAVGITGLGFAVGAGARRELAAVFENRSKLASFLIVGGILIAHQQMTDTDETYWASANIQTELIDSPLIEEAEITGRYAEVSLQGIRSVVAYYEDVMGFYLNATEEFKIQAEETSLLKARDGFMTAVFFTDRHCNIGVNPFISALTSASNADAILDTGDTTISGTPAEGFCIRNLVDLLETNPELVAVTGNHDSNDETKRQLEQSGFTVLAGDSSTEIKGITLVGTSDPRRSPFGERTRFYQGESIATAASIIRRSACANDADLVLAHDARMAELALRRGCAQTSLSGHVHRPSIAKVATNSSLESVRPGVQIIGDNISGASEDGLTFAKPTQNVTGTILQFNQETGRLSSYQTVTIAPSGNVRISEIIEIS